MTERTTGGGLRRIEALPFAPELAIAANVLIWSSTSVIIKDLYDYFSPLAFTSGRFVITCLVALIVLWFYRRGGGRSIAIDRADWLRFAACGLTGFTIFQLCYIIGLDRSTAFASSILGALTPIFAMVLLFFIGERSPLIVWIGVMIAFGGSVVFVAANRGGGGGTLVGNLLLAAAPMVFAVYAIISRPLVVKYPSPVFTFWTLLIGSIPIWIVTAPATSEQNWTGLPVHIWLIFLYLCVFPVYLAYQFWNYGVKHRGVATVSAYSLLVPVLGGVWAWLWLGEDVGGLKLVGGALVLIGLIVMRRVPRGA